MTSILYEDKYTFMITSRSHLLRMKNVSDKNCIENQNAHFMFNNFFPENRAVYELTYLLHGAGSFLRS